MKLGRVVCALAIVTGVACATTQDETPPAPVIPCSSSELGLQAFPAVKVAADDSLPAPVRADLASYLSRAWQRPVEVETAAAPPAGPAIWLSTSEAAKALAGGAAESYALVRKGESIVAWAKSPADLASAAYALLEELGLRFFHPRQELVPTFDGPHLPHALDVHRTPMVPVRGLQLHLLHPLETLATIYEPTETSFDEAKRLVDWLVKTGQNHVQWPLLDSVDWARFAAHARRIVDYAHSRGVTVGAMVQMFQRSSLQHALVLVQDDTKYKEQIPPALDRIMEVPWDDVELAMGEFLATDPAALVAWLDAAVGHLGKIAPKTRVATQNHVGNYPELYSDFKGERTYFYHVPKYADPRLGMTVHTLFFYDLYRDGGMYKHTDFRFQRDFMLSQLPTRRVRYFPESAYWIASDVDVPAFLPEYVESRWVDIHRLDEDVRARKLPPLDGHTMFSSGHEWGYWLTDYLAAKMLWEPGAPLERFLDHYGSAFGSCGASVAATLRSYVALQRVFLFEKKLVAYVSGEDAAVDLAAMVNHPIRDSRKKFDDLVTASEPERVSFETSVLADLESFVAQSKPMEADLAARCRGADAVLRPWCDELRDGIVIVRLRLEHGLLLYRAILAHARGDAPKAKELLADAMKKTEDAKAVIDVREKGYRYDVERLTGAYANPTIYPFGYLRQAHTQCLWRRQDEQARRIVEENLLGSTTGLPSCLD